MLFLCNWTSYTKHFKIFVSVHLFLLFLSFWCTSYHPPENWPIKYHCHICFFPEREWPFVSTTMQLRIKGISCLSQAISCLSQATRIVGFTDHFWWNIFRRPVKLDRFNSSTSKHVKYSHQCLAFFQSVGMLTTYSLQYFLVASTQGQCCCSLKNIFIYLSTYTHLTWMQPLVHFHSPTSPQTRRAAQPVEEEDLLHWTCEGW